MYVGPWQELQLSRMRDGALALFRRWQVRGSHAAVVAVNGRVSPPSRTRPAREAPASRPSSRLLSCTSWLLLACLPIAAPVGLAPVPSPLRQAEQLLGQADLAGEDRTGDRRAAAPPAAPPSVSVPRWPGSTLRRGGSSSLQAEPVGAVRGAGPVVAEDGPVGWAIERRRGAGPSAMGAAARRGIGAGAVGTAAAGSGSGASGRPRSAFPTRLGGGGGGGGGGESGGAPVAAHPPAPSDTPRTSFSAPTGSMEGGTGSFSPMTPGSVVSSASSVAPPPRLLLPTGPVGVARRRAPAPSSESVVAATATAAAAAAAASVPTPYSSSSASAPVPHGNSNIPVWLRSHPPTFGAASTPGPTAPPSLPALPFPASVGVGPTAASSTGPSAGGSDRMRGSNAAADARTSAGSSWGAGSGAFAGSSGGGMTVGGRGSRGVRVDAAGSSSTPASMTTAALLKQAGAAITMVYDRTGRGRRVVRLPDGSSVDVEDELRRLETASAAIARHEGGRGAARGEKGAGLGSLAASVGLPIDGMSRRGDVAASMLRDVPAGPKRAPSGPIILGGASGGGGSAGGGASAGGGGGASGARVAVSVATETGEEMRQRIERMRQVYLARPGGATNEMAEDTSASAPGASSGLGAPSSLPFGGRHAASGVGGGDGVGGVGGGDGVGGTSLASSFIPSAVPASGFAPGSTSSTPATGSSPLRSPASAHTLSPSSQGVRAVELKYGLERSGAEVTMHPVSSAARTPVASSSASAVEVPATAAGPGPLEFEPIVVGPSSTVAAMPPQAVLLELLAAQADRQAALSAQLEEQARAQAELQRKIELLLLRQEGTAGAASGAGSRAGFVVDARGPSTLAGSESSSTPARTEESSSLAAATPLALAKFPDPVPASTPAPAVPSASRVSGGGGMINRYLKMFSHSSGALGPATMAAAAAVRDVGAELSMLPAVSTTSSSSASSASSPSSSAPLRHPSAESPLGTLRSAGPGSPRASRPLPPSSPIDVSRGGGAVGRRRSLAVDDAEVAELLDWTTALDAEPM